jgi:hypothetical protein
MGCKEEERRRGGEEERKEVGRGEMRSNEGRQTPKP